MAEEQDLCANCGRWREEHYDQSSQWRQGQPCSEYRGTRPTDDRREQKADDLKADREARGIRQ